MGKKFHLTPATVIDPTLIYPCVYLRNDHTDSWHCPNWKVTPVPHPVFHKFFTLDPGLREKRRVLPESTPELWIQCHLWTGCSLNSEISLKQTWEESRTAIFCDADPAEVSRYWFFNSWSEVKVSRNGPERRSGKRIIAGTPFRLEFLVG